MHSVTLDTNIFVSALNYGGPCLRILDMARDGLIRLDLSNSILEEIGDVLRKRFHWPEDDIVLAQLEIASVANQVSPQERLPVVGADPDDDRIIECAHAARSDFLITGDKHLLKMKSWRSTKIVLPAEFLRQQRAR